LEDIVLEHLKWLYAKLYHADKTYFSSMLLPKAVDNSTLDCFD